MPRIVFFSFPPSSSSSSLSRRHVLRKVPRFFLRVTSSSRSSILPWNFSTTRQRKSRERQPSSMKSSSRSRRMLLLFGRRRRGATTCGSVRTAFAFQIRRGEIFFPAFSAAFVCFGLEFCFFIFVGEMQSRHFNLGKDSEPLSSAFAATGDYHSFLSPIFIPLKSLKKLFCLR